MRNELKRWGYSARTCRSFCANDARKYSHRIINFLFVTDIKVKLFFAFDRGRRGLNKSFNASNHWYEAMIWWFFEIFNPTKCSDGLLFFLSLSLSLSLFRFLVAGKERNGNNLVEFSRLDVAWNMEKRTALILFYFFFIPPLCVWRHHTDRLAMVKVKQIIRYRFIYYIHSVNR